jgi:hypothetical protein
MNAKGVRTAKGRVGELASLPCLLRPMNINPNGVAHAGVSGICATPLELDVGATATQGRHSCLAPTLGFVVERRWRSIPLAFMPLDVHASQHRHPIRGAGRACGPSSRLGSLRYVRHRRRRQAGFRLLPSHRRFPNLLPRYFEWTPPPAAKTFLGY